MTDEWKWVLRSAPPRGRVPALLRKTLPPDPPKRSRRKARRHSAPPCSATPGDPAGFGRRPRLVGRRGKPGDLGTPFAWPPLCYGTSKLLVSGNLGYAAQTGFPAAAFRTSFTATWPKARRKFRSPSPDDASRTRRRGPPGQESAMPMVRTMSRPSTIACSSPTTLTPAVRFPRSTTFPSSPT